MEKHIKVTISIDDSMRTSMFLNSFEDVHDLQHHCVNLPCDIKAPRGDWSPRKRNPDWDDKTKHEFSQLITKIESKLTFCFPQDGMYIDESGFVQLTEKRLEQFSKRGAVKPSVWGIWQEETVKKDSRKFFAVGDEVIYQYNLDEPYYWYNTSLFTYNNRPDAISVDVSHLKLVLQDLDNFKST